MTATREIRRPGHRAPLPRWSAPTLGAALLGAWVGTPALADAPLASSRPDFALTVDHVPLAVASPERERGRRGPPELRRRGPESPLSSRSAALAREMSLRGATLPHGPDALAETLPGETPDFDEAFGSTAPEMKKLL